MLNLEPIKARDKARTLGEWIPGFSGDEPEHIYFHVGPEHELQWHLHAYGKRYPTRADGLFIAACSVDVPALIAEIEQLRELQAR